MSTLTGAMYTGISGLTTHSKGISVVGNNLANSNTLGYKATSIQFEDLFYSSINTANGADQIGHGSTVSTLYSNFSQGSYQSSSSVTDVAVSGKGFFIVTNPATGKTYYTRSGNFTFNDDGYLVNAQGYRVQGWEADPSHNGRGVSTIGALGDIQLDDLQSPPQATSLMTMLVNLDKDSEERSANTTNPFFALQQEWDGTADPPLGETRYTYQTSMVVYDEAGGSHEVTVYFDPVQDDAVVSDAGGGQVWEYIVTCNPSEDGRTIDGQELSGTSSAGLLMTGTLTFDSSSQLTGITAFTLADTATGDLHNLSNWTPADIDDDGLPIFTANFSGSEDASHTGAAGAVNIGLNFGVHNRTPAATGWDGAVANAAAVGTDINNLFNFTDPVFGANASTSYDTSSSTLSRNQDGYPPGFLDTVEIDKNGVVSGVFTNGETLELFVIGLADFANYQGLISEGGNLFSASGDSGLPITGIAGTNGFGSISSNTLEQSNVDYSGEMVDLIRFQRGYQANSKVITTVDSLLQEAINLKR
ncbi:flagellar biosynthesis protein FlgE [Oceanidesulfovibrio indonesiensis]|uniref:Flagellar hook protein FlgE n=1 Tax=Oceanidesulfovibrio indonesiensis TaxID=54767 RepID=A0A7M3MC94_9BACT|nr:flagellar hook protein FlgE [Oceanidesulfovibrio indonesiensis]TVM15937.1 flagellar biosynthesis protein FlgE [Oceanidesulfovibrio indonesiensis]